MRTADPVNVIGPIELNTDKLVYLRRRHEKLTVVGLDSGEFHGGTAAGDRPSEARGSA